MNYPLPLYRLIVVVSIVTASVCGSSSPLSKSPICQKDSLSAESNFEIAGSVLLRDKLLLIVLDGKQRSHIVHEISLLDISITRHMIYLGNSNPMPMKQKWGFEPAESNRTIVTAFGRQSAAHALPSIVFVYQEGQNGQIFHLGSNTLEEHSFGWKHTGRVVFSLDNDGYLFEWTLGYWHVQECAFRANQFELGHNKYFVLTSPVHQLMLFKRTGPRVDERFLDWSQFHGFIFYNYVHLFHNRSVYVLEDNREYPKASYEHVLSYRKYSYDSFFSCKRAPADNEFGDQNAYIYQHESHEKETLLQNGILFGLLLVVVASFCIRSRIIKSNNATRKMYYNNGY